jgi:hypothetical protein
MAATKPKTTKTTRTRSRKSRASSAIFVALLLLATTPALGQTQLAQTQTRASDTEDEPLGVRVALSKEAAKRLSALRVRRLIAIELEGFAEVDPNAVGPLGDVVVRVWIDAPNPRRVLIEVRREGRRATARRGLAIADFSRVVAARVVSIAAAEMVRVQARIGRDATPVTNGPQDPVMDVAAFAFDAGFGTMLLPVSQPLALFGPELALEHRAALSGAIATSQTIYGRYLIGESDRKRARWLELGAAIELRLMLSRAWRMRLGVKGGGIVLGLPHALQINGAPVAGEGSGGEEWSARLGGVLGVEAKLEEHTWLSLSAEPGGMLRSINIDDRRGERSHIEGFAMLFGVGLVVSP